MTSRIKHHVIYVQVWPCKLLFNVTIEDKVIEDYSNGITHRRIAYYNVITRLKAPYRASLCCKCVHSKRNLYKPYTKETFSWFILDILFLLFLSVKHSFKSLCMRKIVTFISMKLSWNNYYICVMVSNAIYDQELYFYVVCTTLDPEQSESWSHNYT